MALLDATGRARVAAQWMRQNRSVCAFTKPDLAAAVAAIDQWIEDNQASFNSFLPQPYRSLATTTQKADLFCEVLMRRVGRHRAEED
ncbi:hypothetical protein ACFWYW_55845 [Nonomuraea sp. NPDC059023]|uniref:hypothetical protein n=1 Tax=unclassified Nonomuraea TaxID=2593643 RepID=UPI0036A834C8